MAQDLAQAETYAHGRPGGYGRDGHADQFRRSGTPVIKIDSDPYVRVQAIRLLWEAEDKKLIPIYLKLLQDDENEEVQAAAAKALGFYIYLGELEKIPTDFHHETEARLLKVMGTSKSKIVRLRALEISRIFRQGRCDPFNRNGLP